MPEPEKQRNFWEKVESFAKILAGFSAAISAILIPVLINTYTEENRRAEMFVKTMTEREKADTDIRRSMFETLLNGYLGSLKEDFVKGDEDSFRRRITFLELLAVNFQEFFNAKPLFAEVYAGLERKWHLSKTDDERKKWDNLKLQIIRVSKNIASRQTTLLNNIGPISVLIIKKDEKTCVRLYDQKELQTLKMEDGVTPLEIHLSGGCPDNGISVNHGADIPKGTIRQSLEITPVHIDKAYATLRIRHYNDFFKEDRFQGSQFKVGFQFDSSYFDMPYMDNTKLSDGSRFSLVLKKIIGDSVEVQVVWFKNDFMSLRDRPLFEEMLEKLEKES